MYAIAIIFCNRYWYRYPN